MCGPTLYAARGSSSPFGPSPRTSSTHSRAGTDRVVVFVPASLIICVHIVSPIQKCRKIRGLGCVNQACTRARFTQPSPHILLHICTMIDKLIMKSCVTLAQSHLRVTKPWTRCSAHKFFRTWWLWFIKLPKANFVMWQLATNQDRRPMCAGRVRRLRLLLLRPKSEFIPYNNDNNCSTSEGKDTKSTCPGVTSDRIEIENPSLQGPKARPNNREFKQKDLLLRTSALCHLQDKSIELCTSRPSNQESLFALNSFSNLVVLLKEERKASPIENKFLNPTYGRRGKTSNKN